MTLTNSNTLITQPSDEGTILSVEGLSVSYGGVRAVQDVSFSVKKGSVLAVLGPNGAGKSSLARALCGLVPTTAGAIRFAGSSITGLPAHRIARKGLTYIPEGRGVFTSLSVLDNLRMAVRLERSASEKQRAIHNVFEMFPALVDRQQQRAGTLSGGEQQMLALSRAFCGNAQLLIADEVSLGLAPVIVEQVFMALKTGKELGITILIAEQFVEQALKLADDCIILQRGGVVWAGSARDAGEGIQSKYLGMSLEN
jgi:branched-chain amino acid transport system ATP-binding protein